MGLRIRREIEGADVEFDFPLSECTTWKAGGPARALAIVEDIPGLRGVIAAAGEDGLPAFILGRGSNLLFSDAGFDGVVIRLSGSLGRAHVEGDTVVAGGGATIAAAATTAAGAGLSGLEFSSGIPGTVGGAVVTNAGAFGSSTAVVLEVVEALGEEGDIERYSEFEDRYRTGLVPGRRVILSSRFRLLRGDAHEIGQRMRDYRARRSSTQPLGKATAGSVFRNPEGHSAGRLIEECGLKGRAQGRARISDLHANFIINEGGATASDIKSLIDTARSEVEGKFGVRLELEVELIGFDQG